MAEQKHFSAQKKIEILREHMDNNIPVSKLAEEYDIAPSLIYYWKKQLFEGAIDTFSQSKKDKLSQDKRYQKLKQKLSDRDFLISEIVSENIRLKKNLNGED